jgi:hypothetical protein
VEITPENAVYSLLGHQALSRHCDRVDAFGLKAPDDVEKLCVQASRIPNAKLMCLYVEKRMHAIEAGTLYILSSRESVRIPVQSYCSVIAEVDRTTRPR